MSLQPTVTPCLSFDGRAEEAVAFYCGIFRRSKTIALTRCPDAEAGSRAGSVLSIDFELDGQPLTARNGRVDPTAVSSSLRSFPADGRVDPTAGEELNGTVALVVHCDTQDEIDRYWQLLSEGGRVPQKGGWLKDKFGVTWRIVPNALTLMLRDSDAARVERVLAATLTMEKLDLAALKSAYG